MQKVVKKTDLHDRSHSDRDYWLSQPPKARIEAVWELTRQFYDTDLDAAQGLPRVLAITKRPLR